MSENTKDFKQQGLQKHVSSAKGKFIAVGLMFIVACSFSYAMGVQQQGTNQISSGPVGASVGGQLEQNNVQTSTGDSTSDSLAGQSLSANEQYGQDSFGANGQMRHGGSHGGSNIQQDNIATSQNYNATPQRCCATGKTGTCHS